MRKIKKGDQVVVTTGRDKGKAREQLLHQLVLPHLVDLVTGAAVHRVEAGVVVAHEVLALAAPGGSCHVALDRPVGDLEDGRADGQVVPLACTDLAGDAQEHLLAHLLRLGSAQVDQVGGDPIGMCVVHRHVPE